MESGEEVLYKGEPRSREPAGIDSQIPEELRARARRHLRLIRRPEFGSLIACIIVYAFFAIVAGGHDFVN